MGYVSSNLWLKKAAIEEAAWHETDVAALADGEVLLEVEKFALTANNITYAAVGDGFGYWDFFPTGDADYGIVPVWGFAKIVESKHDGLMVGERVFGYLPFGQYLRVAPAKVTDGSFMDGSVHRSHLAIIYNQYSRLQSLGDVPDQQEAVRALYQVLFTTGFLIENFFRTSDWMGADSVVMTSASSKTALGCASVCKNSSPDIKRIGLTSAGNVDFVESTGFYDQVVAYEDLAAADHGQNIVSVDFAGNSQLLHQIHSQWKDRLKNSTMVGATHIDARGDGGGDLEGPEPAIFFAPTVAEALSKSLGPQQFQAAVAEQFEQFARASQAFFQVENIAGKEALLTAYGAMQQGTVAPARGLMCHFAQ